MEKTKKEIVHVLGCAEEDILEASGKTGLGVQAVLERVIDRVPAPSGQRDGIFRALIFDSVYNVYKGVVACVRVVDGSVRRDDILHMLGTGHESVAIEVGFFKPNLVPTPVLEAGMIGYVATGLKEVVRCCGWETRLRGNPRSAAIRWEWRCCPGIARSSQPCTRVSIR